MFRLIQAWFRTAARRREQTASVVRLRVEGLETREAPANLLWDLSVVGSTVGTVSTGTSSLYQPTGYLSPATTPAKVVSYPFNLAGHTNPCF